MSEPERVLTLHEHADLLVASAKAIWLPPEITEPMFERYHRIAELYEKPADADILWDRLVADLTPDTLDGRAQRPGEFVDVERQNAIDAAGHHNLLAVARAATRYVAMGAFLAALWQLQRKAGPGVPWFHGHRVLGGAR